MSIENQLHEQFRRSSSDVRCPEPLYSKIWSNTAARLEMNTQPDTRTARGKSSRPLSTRLAVSTAAIGFLGISLTFSAFLSPVMADTLGRLPVFQDIFRLAGDLGLKTASETGLAQAVEISDAHEGYTLTASQVMYDGLRGSIALSLEENGQPASLFDPFARKDAEDGGHTDKGSFQTLNLSINGTPVQGGWDLGPGVNAGSAILTLNGLPDSGSLGESVLPEQFEATLEFGLAGINDNFTLQIPVHKNTVNRMLRPEAGNVSDGTGLEFVRAELSPLSTRVSLKVHNLTQEDRPLLFDMTDESGMELALITSQQSDKVNGTVQHDLLFEPLGDTERTVEIKPYFYQEHDGKWEKQTMPEWNLRLTLE